MGAILYILGVALAFVGGIWIVVIAFKEHIGWGLATLFIPFVSLYYAITRWAACKTPFLISLAGIAVMIVGILVFGATAPTAPMG